MKSVCGQQERPPYRLHEVQNGNRVEAYQDTFPQLELTSNNTRSGELKLSGTSEPAVSSGSGNQNVYELEAGHLATPLASASLAQSILGAAQQIMARTGLLT